MSEGMREKGKEDKGENGEEGEQKNGGKKE